MTIEVCDRVRGMMLGGAVGDALGVPAEFQSWYALRQRYGPDGVTDMLPSGQWPAGTVSDDTQMTLFTCEALVRWARGPRP